MKANPLSILKAVSLNAACNTIERSVYAQNFASVSLSKQIASVFLSSHNANTVYDIGANKGLWSKEWSKILSGSNFYLFEGSESHRTELANTGFEFVIGVLGDKDDVCVDFFESIDGSQHTGSGLYPEILAEEGRFVAKPANMRRLDSIVMEYGFPWPDFIKLDVQGGELDILKGAGELLDHAKLVLMEAPVFKYNKGAPRLNDYISYMESKGMSCLAIAGVHYSMNTSYSSQYDFPLLFQADLLFGRLP